MRLLPNIGFGTEGYPEKVARRLRTLNIGAWMVAAVHGYVVVLFIQFWWLALLNAVAMLLYAAAPLLHRVGPLAASAAVISLFYADMYVHTWLLGNGIGTQFFILLGAALAAIYFGPERITLTIAAAAIAAALVIALELTIPRDTGLLSQRLIVTSFVGTIIVSAASILLMVSYALSEAARAEAAAEREYQRSELLLTNILPSPIAARLKSESDVTIADRHEEASILFADMAGFTARASDTAPEDLVRFLNRVFSEFDLLVEQHGLEKIKTTGDAYMVVSGVPTPRSDHAQALAALALEMREAATQWRDSHGRRVPLRMGISSGPVVAGVVGTRRFFYDVWGDAVNVAARMETTGSAGRIQVSQATYERIRDEFELEARGEIEVKGKGMMPTWFLLARKHSSSPAPGTPGLRASA